MLNYFSMVATVGTPQTIAAQELRIECMFPADEATEGPSRVAMMQRRAGAEPIPLSLKRERALELARASDDDLRKNEAKPRWSRTDIQHHQTVHVIGSPA